MGELDLVSQLIIICPALGILFYVYAQQRTDLKDLRQKLAESQESRITEQGAMLAGSAASDAAILKLTDTIRQLTEEVKRSQK